MQRKNSSKFLVNIILLIFVLVAFVSVGLFFNAHKPGSFSTPESTNNWKTYTNRTIGFSIKLPYEWLTSECLDSLVFVAPNKESLGVCGSEFGGLINIEKESNNFNANEVIDDKKLKRSEIVFNGINFIKISGTVNGNNYIKYQTNLNGKVFHLLYYHSDPSWANLSATFDQILSTFRFLE